MTKTQLRKKTRELIRKNNKEMLRDLERILKMDCFNLKDYEDNYRLPRIAFQALLREAKHQYGYATYDRKSKKVEDQIYLNFSFIP